MSRSKRRGDSTAPALFPFLAVLLCTIGALVLILVLTVANSHASAKREAEVTMTDIKDTSDIMQVVSEELEAQREDLKAKVERRRRDLADIEDHIARLTKSLEQLASKFERIQSETSKTEIESSEKKEAVSELRKEIDRKKKELIDEIEKQKKRKPAFAVIPYVGANGTSRRPVYLECTKEGVVIQPEGLLISLNDLKPPFGPGNPLDAALRVLRLTYQQKDASFGITQPPYPLLIVRPDGIQTYALAREAMSGWDDQFGYELVDKDMALRFPPSPAGLKEQLISTVEMAKRRQQALIASMPRRVVPQDMDDSWDVIDASRGTQPSGGGNTKGTATNIGSNAETGSGLSASNSTQQEWKLVQGMANSQVASAIQKNGLESQSLGAAGNATIPGNPKRAPNQNLLSLGGADLSGQYGVANGQTNSSPVVQQGSVNGFKPNASMISNESSNGSSNGQFGSDSGSEIAYSASGAAGTSGSNDGSQNSNSGTQNSNSGTQNATSGSNGGASPSGSSNTSGKDGLAGSNAPAPPGANAFSSGSVTVGGASSLSASGSPAQSPTDPSASPNVSVSMNQKPDNQPPKAKHVRAEGDLKPISVSAGHGWAASRAEGKATPVSRPINIVALKDRWLLRSDADPKSFEVNVTMEEGPQRAGDQLAVAMRKRVDSWGLSLPGGYWSPTLTIEAASDAQQSVARLERLLEGSGVEIKVVPLTLPNRR